MITMLVYSSIPVLHFSAHIWVQFILFFGLNNVLNKIHPWFCGAEKQVGTKLCWSGTIIFICDAYCK